MIEFLSKNMKHITIIVISLLLFILITGLGPEILRTVAPAFVSSNSNQIVEICKNLQGIWKLRQDKEYSLNEAGELNITAKNAEWNVENQCVPDNPGYLLSGQDISYHNFQYNGTIYKCHSRNKITVSIGKNGLPYARSIDRHTMSSKCEVREQDVQTAYVNVLSDPKNVDNECNVALGETIARGKNKKVIVFICKRFTKILEKYD